MAMVQRIKLLGTVAVAGEDGRASRIMNSARGMALLAYLIYTDEVQRREQVADLLWEATSTRQSLMRLRELLARVRKWLPEVQTTRQTIVFQPANDTFVDLLLLREGLATEDASRLDEALRLYKGDFLANFYLHDAPYFNEWLVMARERLQVEILAAHHRLCQVYAEAEAWSKGVDVARRWVTLASFDEEAHRWLMQLLAQDGQVTAALQAYELCRQILAEELGIEPEAATVELARQLAEWKSEVTAVALPHLASLENLTANELSEPGLLPANTILPYQRNQDFVGREALLLRIAHLLGEGLVDGRPSVVVITGMGGLGKTQTAVEFCYRYGRYFPGGLFWLSFADAGNVAEEVAAVGSERGLGLFRESEKLSLADQLGRLGRAWQEPIPRLLIFDNCEDEALLAKWLPVTGGCRVLLTSRRGVWARELGIAAVPLQPFNPGESCFLLQQLAPHIQEMEALEIAQEVGHLPLALHLAGGFLHRYRQITATEYMAQLRHKGLLQHPSLQGRGLHHSPTRHDLNVARTYMINLQQLNRAEEMDEMAWQLLLRAACFASGEPIPRPLLLATAVSNNEDVLAILLAEDGIARLVALGFLEIKRNETVVMHHLLLAFTHEVVDGDELVKAQTAVATQMAQTLSAHRQKTGHLSTLPFAPAHLRVVSEAIITQKTPVAASLSILLGSHLVDIGERVEAEQILKRACLIAREAGDTQVQAQAFQVLAGIQESLGHDEESLASATHAIKLFKEVQPVDVTGLVEALFRQGWAHYRLGQAEAALQAANEGYGLSQSAQLLPEKARCLNLMAVVNYYVLGQYEIAQSQMEESLAVYRQLGNRQAESSVLNNMGENARLQGNFATAVQFYEAALAIALEIQNHNKSNLFLSNLCGVRIRLGQFDLATADLESLLASTQQDWYGLSEAYRFLAEAYLAQGKTSPALTMAQQALALAHKVNYFENGRAWRVLALIAAQLDEPVSARITDDKLYDASACFDCSLAYFNSGELERDRAITLWYWAEHELMQGDKEQGKTMWQEAQETFARLKLPLLVNQMNSER
jgi:DNA-binding SARP family transcriptional activator/tetratricopeptide (TPR) repeat protein